jgi:hypothetical protein
MNSLTNFVFKLTVIYCTVLYILSVKPVNTTKQFAANWKIRLNNGPVYETRRYLLYTQQHTPIPLCMRNVAFFLIIPVLYSVQLYSNK